MPRCYVRLSFVHLTGKGSGAEPAGWQQRERIEMPGLGYWQTPDGLSLWVRFPSINGLRSQFGGLGLMRRRFGK